MKEALFYEKKQDKKVQCLLCPHNCILPNLKTGICNARKNINGKLYSLVYSKPCAIQLDPIEKKPLFHFYPGSRILSLGTIGCNLRCQNCQNYQISQAIAEDISVHQVEPKKIIKLAADNHCKLIAFTYTEPTIFYEYMLDISKLAKKYKIKTVIVSNGFINKEPLLKLIKYIDAANIDLKSMNEEFYRKVCSARLQPVLETLRILKQNNVWLEVTNLIIPGLNDKNSDIEELSGWLAENLGKDTPLHFSAFFPTFRMLDKKSTPKKTLQKAKKTAGRHLNYVYLGNLPAAIRPANKRDIQREKKNASALGGPEDTFCPKCKKLLIKREHFQIIENSLKNGRCPKCKTIIPGQWEL